MKILVTGGCGFIGSNFIRLMLAKHADWWIVNLDKLTYAGNPANVASVANDPRYRFVQVMLPTRKSLTTFCRKVDLTLW